MEKTTVLEIKEFMKRSVLCWLATSSNNRMPNVSPKEVFTYYETDTIIIANIASPQSVRNIHENENVCVSFIDILVQKGYQIKGKAEIITSSAVEFSTMEKALTSMTDGKFPFNSITKIGIEQAKKIIAPKYLLYPETTEHEQIERAKKAYRL